MSRVYESNGPDVKIRGNPSHIAEKYVQLARDAQSSGDPVAAENYYQHAEHYFRLIAAAQEQFRQQNPQFNNRPETDMRSDMRDDAFEDGEEDSTPTPATSSRCKPAAASPTPSARASRSPICRAKRSRSRNAAAAAAASSRSRRPAAAAAATTAATSIGCRRSSPAAQPQTAGGQQASQGTARTATTASRDRFPLHRRRRRHRGPRDGGQRDDAAPQD